MPISPPPVPVMFELLLILNLSLASEHTLRLHVLFARASDCKIMSQSSTNYLKIKVT